MSKAPNFTPAQEQAIRDAAPLNLATAKSVGEAIGKGYRSVIAKALRMGVEYQSKAPTRKDGTPVARKEALVAEIATLVEGNLDGLEKAPREALVALRAHLAG